jgi:hypothetical protein
LARLDEQAIKSPMWRINSSIEVIQAAKSAVASTGSKSKDAIRRKAGDG